MPEFNAAFWKWFGKSVVRNADGSPKIVYHGTPSGRKFHVFDIEKAGKTHASALFGMDRGFYGRGFYFSANYDVAATYLRGSNRGRVIAVYLRIEKPVDLQSDILPDGFRDAIDHLRMSRTDIRMSPISDAHYAGVEKWWRAGSATGEAPVWGPEHGRGQFLSDHQRVFELLGYDGVIANENEIVVFHPEQIKSTDNDGTWDTDDQDIASNPPSFTVRGLGEVPWHREIKYRGFILWMRPSVFLKLAAPLVIERTQTLAFLKKHIQDGGEIAPPFLQVSWDRGRWKVNGHEGRHRSKALIELGIDDPIPVYVFPEGIRRHQMEPAMWDALSEGMFGQTYEHGDEPRWIIADWTVGMGGDE